MGNGVLKGINDDLDMAKQYVKRAGSRAGGAGDKSGVKKCDEMEEKIDDLKEDFSKKGK